jgi:hypothetical protein
MSKEKEYQFIKPLSKKPELPTAAPRESKTRKIAEEFVNSGIKYAEVLPIEEYKSVTSLARAIGRALHGRRALDPKDSITVASDKEKGKVYLIRK